MRKFYEEYFHIPENGKIQEKVMLTRVALTVTTMVLCLIAMSITAYAYFSHEASYGTHTIKAASFSTSVDVQIVDENGNVVETVDPLADTSAAHKVALEKGKTYTITIAPIDTATAANTGFVIVKADGCADVYHTQQLYKPQAKSAEGKDTTLRFRLTVTEDTVVHFVSHWGTSVHYVDYRDKGENDRLYIVQNEEVELEVASSDKNPPVSEEEPTATTASTFTTTVVEGETTTTASTTTTTVVNEEITTTASTSTTTIAEEETTTTESTTTTTVAAGETTTLPAQPDAIPTESIIPEETE